MRRRTGPLLRTLAGAVILAVLVRRLGAGAFTAALREVDGRAVFAALGIGLLTTVLSAWRWRLVADRLGLRLPLARAVADYYRALLLNAVLPAGVLGDVHRAVHHGRRSGDVGRGVRAVVLERVAGQAVVLVLGGAVLLARPSLVASLASSSAPGPAGRLAAAGAAVAAAVAAVPALRTLRRKAARREEARREEARRETDRGRDAPATAPADARRVLLARGAWPGVVLASAAAMAGHVALFLVAARAAGSAAPAADLVPPLVLALLVMGIPLNVGGWGPREAAAALAFGAAGLGADRGLATSVVYGVLTLVAALPGAAVLLAPAVAALAGRLRRGAPRPIPGEPARTAAAAPGAAAPPGASDAPAGPGGARRLRTAALRGSPGRRGDAAA
ncbi:flippase-like domain-containing protein [Streptacidiphilus sp. ASG 303]|uniref:lysylphosphatidylglycerol synthase transmembrane domain-containing protein n=1 Tax=Streptacidiphilus sp. ASG 303 TaxID=2896847 RepID=UPI001E37B8A6|nr:lysylphosphatidylglycerol synthase transmembrane domain-containing protein [Streptacidiphilus sp. ASG 303]MCD0484280.1 flippase-like domain-containing protein [Streptacidiphilus sp. ASG 303]